MDPFDEHLLKYRKEGIEYLRTTVPEIQKLESLDDLHDLKLVGEIDSDLILILKYEANAPSLFPFVRQRLLDKGLAKRHNILNNSTKNRGTYSELYHVRMGFYGNMLQISLSIHK